MIPKLRERNIEYALGDVETAEMKAAVNSKMFEILTNTLYENKIQSLIRELMSNADDSHAEAGIKNKVPIKVTLPTYLDSTFAIRDFGVGMDHETVMGTYLTLFDTTKDGSNDFTGYIGVGSKSPFAYTNTFTVTAFEGDGSKRVYVLSIGEQGIPEIKSLGKFETDEPRGVEVMLSVADRDISRFKSEAERVFLGYDLQPDCNIEVTPAEVVFRSGESCVHSWRVVNLAPLGSQRRGNLIRQGTVCYGYDGRERLFYNKVLVIDVLMGSLGVAASRESLSLDDVTKAYVDELLDEVYEEVRSTINEALLSEERYQDANRLYTELVPGINRFATKDRWNPINQRPGETVTLGTPIVMELDARVARFSHASTKKEWLSKINGTTSVPVSNYSEVVIDRGDKVKRRMARVQDALEKTNSLFIENPSNKDLEKLHRLLPSTVEFTSVVNLHDPGPPVERSHYGARGLRGHYSRSGNRYTSVEQLPKDFLWVEVLKPNANDFGRSSFDYRTLGPYVNKWFLACRDFDLVSRHSGLAGIVEGSSLIFVTPTVAKKLPETTCLRAVVQKVVDKFKLEEEAKRRAVAMYLTNNVKITPEMEVEGEDIQSIMAGPHPLAALLPENVRFDPTVEGERLKTLIEEKYPLVSNPDAIYELYVNSINQGERV